MLKPEVRNAGCQQTRMLGAGAEGVRGAGCHAHAGHVAFASGLAGLSFCVYGDRHTED